MIRKSADKKRSAGSKLLAVLAALILVAPVPAAALTASSTNFYIRQNLQGTSGGSNDWSFSTSTTFKLLTAAGQTADGTSTSGTSFNLHAGFLGTLFRSVKPVYTQEHYHWRLDNGSETTATAVVAEDTASTTQAKTITTRLRIALSNEGGTEAQYATQQPRLEYGTKVTSCAAIVAWTDVGAALGDWDMSNTANLTNGGDTTNIATGIGGVTDENRTFITDNNAILDTASAPSALSIPSDSYMELEYSIQALSAATDGATYCFRVTNAGTATLYAYDVYPEATVAGGNALPIASAVSIDSGAASVTLTENTTKNVVCAGTVTDTNGFADITAVGAFLYRTGVGTSTASDNNNLYRMYGDSQCVPSGGSGSSETYTCTFPVQYYADATDAGSAYSADIWSCELHPRDAIATGTPAIDTSEMASLMALDVTASIPYGSVNANADTGASNQLTTVTNTGNRDMDPELSGTTMTSGGNSIAIAQQKYSDAGFTYSGGGTTLSGSPTQVNLTLPQRTDDSAGGFSAPTFVQENETVWNTSALKTTSSFNVQTSDILVAFALSATYDSGNALFNDPTTISSSPSLTWTNLQTVQVNTYTWLGLWIATSTSNTSMTVSFADADSTGEWFGGNVLQFRGSGGTGATTKTNVASGAPSLGITNLQSSSAIVVASGDWVPNNGSGRTWRTSGVGTLTEQSYFFDAAHYTLYGGYHADAGASGAKTVGLSAPGSQKYSIAAVEVYGTTTSSSITDIVYWGLGVPNGSANGSYTGTNTFTAAAGI